MNCKNCTISLNSESDYCNKCGAKVIRNRLTIRNLFEHFTETFLNYDNKFLQTFICLFTKPEDVIGSYIDGTRKKYVNVVSYFAVAITLSGLQLFILNNFFPDAMDMSAWTTNGTEEFQSKIMSYAQEYQSLIMMMYVPVYALICKIVFLNRKTYNYTEQLVMFMYIQAQISITSAIIITLLIMMGANFSVLGMLMFPTMIAYSAYCLKRLYQLNLMELILKTLIFFIVFGIIAILFTIGMTAMMYFSGDFEKIIEAQRAAKGS